MCEIDAYLSGFAGIDILHARVKKIKVKMSGAFWSITHTHTKQSKLFQPLPF